MTSYVGYSGTVTVGGTAVGEVKSYSFTSSSDMLEDTALGDTAHTYKAGLTNWTATITANFDPDDAVQDAMINGASAACIFLPEGNTSGDVSYTANGIISEYTMTVNTTDIVEITFNVQGTGSVTIGTVA